MSHSLKELVRLLEIRTMSSFERRKRRLQCIPLDVVPEALNRARNGLPLTIEQYMASHLGFLPGERDTIERREAKVYSQKALAAERTERRALLNR